ncbi:MAG: hypothetical protein GY856_46855 [bacterium]|nr:hypothetical protein [bacterium]
MEKSFWKGCFVLGTCIWIGSSLMMAGCQNHKIAAANEEIHQIALKEVVTTPPEIPQWVEIEGIPIAGSLVTEKSSRYLLLMDPEGEMAAFVKLEDDSPLPVVRGETIVRGMASPSEAAAGWPRKELPPEVKVANLVIVENKTPPGWWATVGLLILGFFIIGGPAGHQASEHSG